MINKSDLFFLIFVFGVFLIVISALVLITS